MNYVTTNIRIPEQDYLRLKSEAALKRTSLSAVIREKIREKTVKRSPHDAKILIKDLDDTAKSIGVKLKGFDAIATIRKMREER